MGQDGKGESSLTELRLSVRQLHAHHELGVDFGAMLDAMRNPMLSGCLDRSLAANGLSADGDLLEAVSDVGAADVVDDIVDEIIEIILLRGGWVALLESGAIPGGARIAVTEQR